MNTAKGPNTTLGGMHDILFRQLERIANQDLTGEVLEEEMRRSDAICDLTKTIIDNGLLAIQVAKLRQDAASMAPEVDYLLDAPQPKRLGNGKKVV